MPLDVTTEAHDDHRDAELAVVIPSYRRPDLLGACLESVAEAIKSTSAKVEVVVVEDGADPRSCELVRREHGSVTLVALDENRGYPGAVNAGVSASKAPWILTLNNDTTVRATAFDETLRVARSARDIGSVALQQRFSSDPARLYSAGLVLDQRGQVSDRLMGRPVAESEASPIEVFGACGAAAAYRRSALEDVGGFDERFRFGLEDADVSWRLSARGWRCLYAPAAVVYHDLGGTIAHGTPFRLFQAGRNRVLLLAKNLDSRQAIRHSVSILSFDAAYVAYGALRLRRLAPLRGRLAGIRLIGTLRRETKHQRRPVPLAAASPWQQILDRRRNWRLARSDPTADFSSYAQSVGSRSRTR